MTEATRLAPPADLAERIALYLEDMPSDGAHSDAAGANCWELLSEAAAALRAIPQEPIAQGQRKTIAQIIDPEAAWGVVVETDSPANERILRALAKADAILAALAPSAQEGDTCRYCNGTKRALYFTEQGWAQEWRDCHICSVSRPDRSGGSS